MKVLVTGANGFIGSWLVRRLVSQGHNVRILARPTSDLSELDQLDYETHRGDITDEGSLIKAVSGVDIVYNLAGLIAYKKIDRHKMEAVNVDGTCNILRAMNAKNVNRLVHMSSVVAIGSLFEPGTPMNEQSEYNLKKYNFGYFETKRKSELLVREWHELKRGEALIFNPSTVYGAGDARKSSRKTQIKVAKGQFRYYSPGGVSIAHIDDVIDVLTRVIEKKFNGERYILAGENITIKTLFELIAKCAGVNPPKFRIPGALIKGLAATSNFLDTIGLPGKLPDGESILVSQMYHWYDSQKAINELSYKTRPAKNCISDSVIWMKTNKII